MRFLLLLLVGPALLRTALAAERPNVVWLTSEDTGPHLGCYGDAYSVTPHLDALAAKGCRYAFCWSNAPVCAPARTTLITGMYPPSIGAEHMRSMVTLPEEFRLYPEYLREAGYYCTNNAKEDYNVPTPRDAWDESSQKAHWKNRAEGQPFFAVFNSTISHESQIRNDIDPADRIHDPAGVRIPAYMPDRPEIRKDWAQYYDRLTMMDRELGARLAELDEAGLTDDTIIFYYGDHGSGMPRNKRWCYDSGLHVPLLVFIPEKWRSLASADYQTGGVSERLVSFVDFAPTLLSLCGVMPPEHFQGTAFLGPAAGQPREYVFGFRGRMDERLDMVRSVSDGRYVYIRNYQPHRPYGQHVSYMFQTPTTRVWQAAYLAGELNEAQSAFWKTKPSEELYDLENDPDEVHNLVGKAGHAQDVAVFRIVLEEHLLTTRDLGFIPESERALASGDKPQWELRDDSQAYSLRWLLAVSDLATQRPHSANDLTTLVGVIADDQSPSTKYWAVQGLLASGEEGVRAGGDALRQALADDSPTVRIAAAEALGRYGTPADVEQALAVLIAASNVEQQHLYVVVAALNAIDELDARAAPLRERLETLPRTSANVPKRSGDYIDRLLTKILADLDQIKPEGAAP